MAARPVVLNVCAPCLAGDLTGDFVEDCAICLVVCATTGGSDPEPVGPLPARSREEMVAAGAAAVQELDGDGFWLDVGDATDGDPARYDAAVLARAEREAAAVLNAALGEES